MAVPRIGVINATPLSMVPFTVAMQVEFPQADIRHVLDDSLLRDLRAAGRLTVELEGRMERLIEYVLAGEVAALQFACSGYSPVVARAAERLSIPVRKPDEAMYRELAGADHDHVGILATVQAALELAEQQLGDLLSAQGSSARITTRCLTEAMDAAESGDDDELTRMLTEAVRELTDSGVSVVAFAQYSMSPVADEVARATGVGIVTGPRAAARDLRSALHV
jgi:Asp/Glu/hydantoin racemase